LRYDGAALAQTPAPTITEVRVEQEGRVVSDALVLGLLETTVGDPLSMADVRESITHLNSLGRYEDIQVFQEAVSGGTTLRYQLFPLHPVDRLEFKGVLGLPEGELRRAVTERFGTAPLASRAPDVARALELVYHDAGYLRARITPRIDITHDPDRASMTFAIEAGTRARIARVEFDVEPTASMPPLPTAVTAGQPYDNAAILAALQSYEATQRERGYYEARATHSVDFVGDDAIVRISIEQGPLVAVAFAGDPLPESERDRLVPVRAEGATDEDLLENSSLAIEGYLHERGYRDATATYTREETPGALTIRFTIARGSRYLVDGVSIGGNASVPAADITPLVRLKEGDPFVQSAVDGAAGAIRALYRSRGFTKAMIMTAADVPPAGSGRDVDRRVRIRLDIVEGPQTLVSSVSVDGNTALGEAQLRPLLSIVTGSAYSEADVASNHDRLDLEYRNLGYADVVIESRVALSEGDTRAAIVFEVHEGPQVIVDHVIILGNRRTSTSTIERELTLKPGQPLGYAARIESQQRLSALGIFRRVTITELQGAEPRRDVLVQVEESPPTTIGYGGGVEGGTRLRPTGPLGTAEEHFEFAPRGFFEVGRNNLWGKNRTATLFARASLRPRDIVLNDAGQLLESPSPESGYGLNEYRVFGTYREPKVVNSPADLLITAILDQAIRSSFSFRTREVRAEVGTRVKQYYNVAVRYSLERTKLFDQRFTEDQKPLIDRIFPQVRLSKIANSIIRDRRDDIVDPTRGRLVILDTEMAARTIGSEVGFVKAFGQLFNYFQLPSARRMVLATGVRIGASHGFARIVRVVGDDGVVTSEVVQDLPASERFFAGGDTTVRGFALDRLGTPETISPSGFPQGGNGEVVLNAELRVAVFKGISGVMFVDAGNVFPTASDLSLIDLRPSTGFGVHYRSPIGLIRVELGINLHPQVLVPGTLERRTVLHIALGPAF
jgi:outer membrane protein assembly complex protein YaeT